MSAPNPFEEADAALAAAPAAARAPPPTAGTSSAPTHPPADALEFQEISMGTPSKGAMEKPSAAAAAAAAPSAVFQAPSEPDFADSEMLLSEDPAQGDYRFYQIEYYRPYFNVDTSDVLSRILASMVPFRSTFFATVDKTADLYGPFWISTTLIFVMAVTGNFASYLDYAYHADPDVDGTWEYDFEKVTVAAFMIYTYVSVVPLLLAGILVYCQAPVKVIQVVCIYGYSLSLFVPASVLCALPQDYVQWLVVSLAFGVSGAFLAVNFWPPLKEYMPKRAVAIMISVFGLHGLLTIALKVFVFAYDTDKYAKSNKA